MHAKRHGHYTNWSVIQTLRVLARIMREGAVEGETQEPPCGTNVMYTTF